MLVHKGQAVQRTGHSQAEFRRHHFQWARSPQGLLPRAPTDPYCGLSPVRLQMDRQWRPPTTSRGLETISIPLSSSFHGKLYNRGSAHTTPAAGLASTGHLASVAAAPAAEASLAVR